MKGDGRFKTNPAERMLFLHIYIHIGKLVNSYMNGIYLFLRGS